MVVALLAEGVDRNIQSIIRPCDIKVALLAEGVDRNILADLMVALGRDVALLAEGVDRNPAFFARELLLIGRPPRGGRG